MARETTHNVSNPLADGMTISVSVPADIKIKLVDASILNAYEIWVFIAGLTANFMSGFWVWYGQTDDKSEIKKVLLVVAVLITILFVIFLTVAISRRIQMSKQYKEIELPVGNVHDDSSSSH